MTILDEIAAKTKERVEAQKRICPDPMQVLDGVPVLRRCDQVSGVDSSEDFAFEWALRKSGLSFIAEVKKASPSKGLIASHFPYVEIAREYEAAGANAISCLTEPYYFLGQDSYLTEIKRNVNIPVLRKDFTVDEYMIYEAKALGADAVLLICSILDDIQLRDYHQLCDELKLSALVETHDEREIERALKIGARIVGVNNRNLKNFVVNTNHAGELRSLVPEECVFVSESGVVTREDTKAAEDMHADAVLVGETLMRSDSKFRTLQELSERKSQIKICGLMTEEDVQKVNQLPVQYAGFVFADTRHYVDPEQAAKLKALLREDIEAVGVFVDEDPEEIISLLNKGVIDIAQLHGEETDDTIRLIQSRTGKKVIKAVIMKDRERVPEDYPSADALLLDAGKGSGTTFPWEVLKEYRGKPFFLAGGLNSENVAEAIAMTQPFAVDVSSGVEGENCAKDEEKLKRFVESVLG